MTSLNTAAKYGHLEVFSEMLNHGASVDMTNNYGRVPLNVTAVNSHVEVARELLNHGARVDIANN